MRPSHIVILLVLALVIFGAPRLPMLARSLGESLKIIKKDAGELLDSSLATTAPSAPAQPAPSTLVTPAQAPQGAGARAQEMVERHENVPSQGEEPSAAQAHEVRG